MFFFTSVPKLLALLPNITRKTTLLQQLIFTNKIKQGKIIRHLYKKGVLPEILVFNALSNG